MSASTRGRSIWRVNAFTDRPFAGNPAGVVPQATGLDETQMLAIAAELNDVSETVYIFPPTSPDADLRLRFFTTTTEVDLCGHATMAAMFTLAWSGQVGASTGSKGLRAETAVGTLALGLEYVDGQLQWASMEQLAPEHATAPGAAGAADVLGLPAEALARDLPVACASTGLWACFVPLASVEWLSRISIRPERIQSLWPDNDELSGVYAFALRDDGATQGRFFSPPRYGIFEDPVTGTACGALAAYLIEQGRLDQSAELIAWQGVEMGRPGQVRVRRHPNGRIGISGQAAPVFRGELLA